MTQWTVTIRISMPTTKVMVNTIISRRCFHFTDRNTI